LDIAYQVHGDGPRDLLVVPGLVSHVEVLEQHRDCRRFLQRLASFARVITFDKRGNGLSDRVSGAPTLEERADDARAVLDAAGSDSAALLGLSEGGPMSIVFAATYPMRTSALILWGTFARFMKAPDYPYGATPEILEYLSGRALEEWGEGVALKWFCPSVGDDEEERRFQGQLERLSATPATVRALWQMNALIDIRDILSSVQLDTLVLYRTHDPTGIEWGRHLAENLPNAKMVELDGVDHFPWIGDADSVVDEIEAFLTGNVTTRWRSTGFLRRSCSVTSSGRPVRLDGSGIAGGGACSISTTWWWTGSSNASGAARSSRPVTASSPCSTGRGAPCAAPSPSATGSAASVSTYG
jgi:pimeloyl-ACP methyl ester carboxylesterase